MSKCPTPKPMPTTGMPDRVDTRSVPSDYTDMKKGVTFGKMQVTNGRPPEKNK